MIDKSLLSETCQTALLGQLNSTLEGLRGLRLSFWAHWAALAEVFLPRRYKWFIAPNQWNRGNQINGAVIDETGVLAARTLASGMMSGMTSPTRPWFRLGLADLADVDFGPVKNWLAECERRMLRVMGESNFYQALAIFYHDLGVFGSASALVYDDSDQIIRLYNPCLGEFFFGSAGNLAVDVHAREFTLTVKQICDMFGLANLPDTVAQQYRQGGTQRLVEHVVCHIIEPNTDLWDNAQQRIPSPVAKVFPWRECYWLRENASSGKLLRAAGFYEKPFVGGRWDVSGNDAYGRSPGMDALPAVRQLQIEQRRKAEAIDKLVRPPMNASVNMKNEPASILPGAINYVVNLGDSGFKPAYQIEPRIQELGEDIKEVQARVERVFFADLFLMISSLDTVRTATEIDARREEKLILLGPVIERFENEVLDTLIDRIFSIMARRGLFPEPPPEIAGMAVNVQYISMLAEAQRAVSTAGIERLFQLVGNLVGVNPEVLDTIDWDKGIEVYADRLNVEPEIIRSIQQIMEIRAKKAQQQAAQAAAQASMEMVNAGKTLSETQVGGGVNALESMFA